MKKILLNLLLIPLIQVVFAQSNGNTSPPAQNGSTATNQVQQNPNGWNLYNGSMVDMKTVPPSTMSSFNSEYPNAKNATWYSYDKGYIVSYPGDNQMYQGVLYDKNGKMTGRVKQVRYSTLSPSITSNMKKKYPDMQSDYVYEITSPTGKKTYTTNVNGNWSNFEDSGMYMDDK